MTLPLPHVLTAGSVENVGDVQANFTTLADNFPLARNTTNFQPVPQCYVYASTAQSLPNGPLTTITFDSELFDLGTPGNNMHDPVTNTQNCTSRAAGLYHMIASAPFTANAAGLSREVFIYVNGSQVAGTVLPPAPATKETHIFTATDYRLAVSDIVTMQMRQDSGAALNTYVSGLIAPSLMMYWVSP